jgi:hypothetical protein
LSYFCFWDYYDFAFGIVNSKLKKIFQKKDMASKNIERPKDREKETIWLRQRDKILEFLLGYAVFPLTWKNLLLTIAYESQLIVRNDMAAR